MLLLGCRDHPSVRKEHERAWLAHPCLRPEEEQMLPLAELWQRVAEAAEARRAPGLLCLLLWGGRRLRGVGRALPGP